MPTVDSRPDESKHATQLLFVPRFRRSFNLLLSVSIMAVSIAVLDILIKTSTVLFLQETPLFQVTTHIHTSQAKRSGFQVYHSESNDVLPARHGKSNQKRRLNANHDSANNKLFLVLDFWERMINVQSGLKRLVQLGVDAGFTVVEPFVYESKVSHRFAFPEHFAEKNMTPQTAALYFRTEDLYPTNRYISHDQFRDRARVVAAGGHERNKSSLAKPQYVIQAVVYIDWSEATPRANSSISWCDDKLRRQGFRNSDFGWELATGFHTQRALCLAAKATMFPATFTATLFHDMYAYAANGTTRISRNCDKCVTLAFMNYRKHAFTGFVSHTGARPFRQKTPPLEVGTVPQRLADVIRTELLRNRPYVAIQIRTGKAFVLLEHYEQKLASQGLPFKKHEAFRGWLKTCTKTLVDKARVAAKQLGRRAVFYIASDMYNDGWKGGERCPPAVREAMEEAKHFLDIKLRKVHWFNPTDFGITQDTMGMSGLADAAVCLHADRFMFARPSNFGRWVHEQRVLVHKGAQTVKVDCMDHRFIGK